MIDENPLLSIVACTRNDSHGVNLLKRCSLFVKGLLWQCRKNNFRAELILVEWNPPKGKPLLKDVLPLPKENDFLTIRFVIVPKEIHEGIPSESNLPLHQMIAKNVGIRRAKSEFVLCTNNDLLFSDELFQFLAKNKLKKGTFYRCQRKDVPADIDFEKSIPKLLTYCQSNVLEIYGKHHLFPEIKKINWGINKYHPYHLLLCTASRIRQMLFPKPSDLLISLDLEACGDFTLMSKKDWMDIGGYAEWAIYPVYIDSIALVAARILKKKQVILKPQCCSYHVCHEGGWVPRAKRMIHIKDPIERMLKKLELEQKACFDWIDLVYLAESHRENKRLFEINPENWGFADEVFQEYVF